MSTINFSVPEDVKQTFNRTFGGQNKSAIIADLMRRAIDEAEHKARQRVIFEELSASRDKRPHATPAANEAFARYQRQP